MNDTVISAQHVSKSFRVGIQEISVLKDISFEVKAGDFLIIFGPSGCGKSTLLHVILGLEEPNNGDIYFLGKNLYKDTSEDDRADFRKRHVGMVYQQPNWIRSLTVFENVAFPLLLLGQANYQNLQEAREVLKTVGMFNWQEYIPTELSSGQQQKVALARALITKPEVIIADEPTGNLDYESGQELMQLLTKVNKTRNSTIIMVTHDLEYLNFAKTAVRMFNGEVVGVYSEKDKEKLMTEIKSKRGNGN